MPVMPAVDASATTLIADRTNPWVEVAGTPVDWTTFQYAAPANDCEGCEGMPLPGAWSAMDTAEGIQRCDTCQLFDGDLVAALALADMVGGVALFETEEKLT